jgi:hypothetical protein
MQKPKKSSGNLTKLRQKPGMSNAYKYKGVKEFAGPDKTFPINTLARARNALARAHYAANPGAIRSKVYKKYPALKRRKMARDK